MLFPNYVLVATDSDHVHAPHQIFKKEELPIMLITPAKFVRKPFVVEGVEVTSENIEEVAQWCGGEVRTTRGKYGSRQQKYLKVAVKNPLNERQTKAYYGDWVLSAGTGFKVYTQKAFAASFEEQTDRMFEVIERMDERAHQEETLFDEGLTEPEVRELQHTAV
jgi:hypothetical protein